MNYALQRRGLILHDLTDTNASPGMPNAFDETRRCGGVEFLHPFSRSGCYFMMIMNFFFFQGGLSYVAHE